MKNDALPTFTIQDRLALRRWAAAQRRLRGRETPEELEAKRLAEERRADRARRRRRPPRVRVTP
jgi:hypothetical protein